jgi:hypothetical protein
MRSRALAVAAALAALAPAGVAVGNPPRPIDSQIAVARGPHIGDLPADAPAALYRHEPTLPTATGWPASNTAFPRTSGTGRYAGGGLFWTDYLYDDHGAYTASPGSPAVAAGTPGGGTYTYPAGAAHDNGADIFRAAVALRGTTSYWRVDWTTLADPAVPIAEWTFDRDANPATGGSTWPAGAGVASKGIDTALVMSSHGAKVLDVASGAVRATLPVTVDRTAQSFVVAVPATVLKPTGTWRIRLGAGLADPAGTAFARPPQTSAAQPAVYNATFRTRLQEAPTNNFWNDMAQAKALTAGDVSSFFADVKWSRLAARITTPEARPTGWSDRWYVSAIRLGTGIVTDPSTISDGKPNYLGRVQPYAVYIPAHRPARASLTFLLHSLTQNHNQYAATTPHFTKAACEDRHSICVTTLGRGPDGGYHDEAQLDFWQVWHSVAATYLLDPDRTILCGYSMGGIGSNQIAMEHPDLFARSVTLAGGVGDLPSLVNLRWVPTYLAGGAQDELVWVTTQKQQADAMDRLGLRYRWLVYPAMDHVAYELADSFGDAAAYMKDDLRTTDPEHVTFTWTPRDAATFASSNELTQGGISWTQRPDLAVGTTGAYWLRDLKARSVNSDASVDASSASLTTIEGTPARSQSAATTGGPEPGIATTLDWHPNTIAVRPVPGPALRLHLSNVRSLAVLLKLAGLGHPGERVTLTVDTNGPVAIRLAAKTLHIGAGHHVVRFTT